MGEVADPSFDHFVDLGSQSGPPALLLTALGGRAARLLGYWEGSDASKDGKVDEAIANAKQKMKAIAEE